MRISAILIVLLLCAVAAHAEAALFLEEPFGSFGGVNPTGHAAIYLSRVCAETPVHLRRCEPGETGVVISRYHRVGGYDWIAIPLLPYLYAVENPEDIPASASDEIVTRLRDRYRRARLSQIVPDAASGETPGGEWIELAGSAYDREIYSYEIETTPEQDDRVIAALNSRENRPRFHLLFHNCADFSRYVMDLYYPKAIHRSLAQDMAIMTPKQAARSLVEYSMRHPELRFSRNWIPQVPGALPRSRNVRGVLESFVKSKKYVVPVAVLHPFVAGGLAVAYLTDSRLGLRPRVKVDAAAPVLMPEGMVASLSGPR